MALVTGTEGPDTLLGTVAGDPADARDTILGLDGDDSIQGLGGNDELRGDAGNDTIHGDESPFPPPPRPSGPVPGDNLVFGGEGDDRVIAGNGADTVHGGPGHDRIAGFGSVGGSPSAQSGVKGQDGPDLLLGEEGNDAIDGGGGADTIFGGEGDDTLQGERGVDLLIGGPGGDVFVFARDFPHTLDPSTGQGEGNRDVIADFQDDRDRFDLQTLGPTGRPLGVPDVFLGTNPFEASFGLQVRYEIEGGRTILQIAPGVTGNPPAGIQPTVPATWSEVELSGMHRLTTGHFSLALEDRSGSPPPPPPPPSGEVDWNALAAQVLANFEATGQWFADDTTTPQDGTVDWNALAAEVTANFQATGQWFL